MYVKSGTYKLHNLLPKKFDQIRARQTRSNGQKFYHFKCNTERFKQSPVLFGIEKYNAYLNGEQDSVSYLNGEQDSVQ